MTDEQINIKIAELCGWKRHPKDKWVVIPPNSPNSVQPLFTIPNYAADLNACHEFEKTLTRGSLHNYMLVMQDVKGLGGNNHWLNFHATGRQRCEAFLRVHGQWEEEA